MKHLIMGTAGHIDHGKTALVKALTNFDCDTHPEEKKRGITINLGFSHLDLPNGSSVGIVDVPGHKDFIHTMVSGASGIDFAALVIAADSGVMPQTREHLQIIDVLGIKKGLVALTKTDLVEPDLVELAKEEIKELTAGTCLDACPIIGVSSVTGQGLDELKHAITKLSEEIEERPEGSVFRMFVDRIFTVSGFGTVVNGSVLSGKLSKDSEAYLLPGGEEKLRARRLERHGKEVDSVKAGDRASINLLGLNKEAFKRGMVICDRQLKPTSLIDVCLKVFAGSPKLNLWTQVIFQSGTYEKQARVHLIDKDIALGGDIVLAQVHLETPVVLMHGDKFVIRNSSSELTLGGGEIIDAAPLHHRRRPEKLISEIKSIAEGKLPELVFAEARKAYSAISSKDIADILNVPDEEVRKVIKGKGPQDILVLGSILMARKKHEEFKASVLKVINGYHRRNPLSSDGMNKAELMGVMGITAGANTEKLLDLVLAELCGENKIEKRGSSWAVSGHRVVVGEKLSRDFSLVEDFLKKSGMTTPLLSELDALAKANSISDGDLKQILYHLVKGKKAYFIDGNYIHASIVDGCREKLLRKLAEVKEGLTVAGFRDQVGGNRKICLLLLAQYDTEGVTKRNGDFRIITDKGRKIL
ncbi:MAG: selenocysteine-specific translation elongation factor [Candidatus Margulisiibacteriota bacterium]